MKGIRHTAEPIIQKLKTAEQLIVQGKTLTDMCCAQVWVPARYACKAASQNHGTKWQAGKVVEKFG